MSGAVKSVIGFKSSSGTCNITGYIYKNEAVPAKAILQISHGMCEYIERYEEFALFMADNGYIVCGNDHLGHGKSSDSEGGIDGFFADKDGRDYLIQDLHHMNSLVSHQFGGLPLIMLGHSMGSFMARLYAVTYPETIKALILSGTGGPNPAAGVGIALTKLIGKIKGTQYRSQFINKLAFGAYLKQISSPKTIYDWISSDEKIVQAYVKDKKCTFVFTVSAFNDMMRTLRDVNKREWAEKLDKAMPIYLFSGDKDPVGDYGNGVSKVKQFITDAGVKDVTMKLYENGRHEMLNETNRLTVYNDVLNWCNAHL
ncbi:MAG: alpha/beta hydrolase [Oscillospiraceae bacterium]